MGFNALSEMKDLCDFIYTGFVDMPSILVTYHIWQERHKYYLLLFYHNPNEFKCPTLLQHCRYYSSALNQCCNLQTAP